jgi:uncharacterized membrane protein SirB2
MKHLHLLLVAAVILGFLWRVYLAEKKPEILANKWVKILPHVLATGLLLSGIALVYQGYWFDNYGWIVGKVVFMFAFIGLGILTLKQQGKRRWIAFAGALYFFIFIVRLAITKQIYFW